MEILQDLIKNGGVPIYINLFLSIVVVATIAERLVFIFRHGRTNAENLTKTIMNLVKNGMLDRAIKLAKHTDCMLSRVYMAGLMKANSTVMEISMAMDEQLVKAAPAIEKRISWLWALANIATLIGLVGTILGLIKAFSGLAAVSAEQKTAFLSLGISEALNNTAVGLIIAVSCMIGHLILSTMSKKVLSELETNALSFENYLILRNKTLGTSGESVEAPTEK